MKYIRARVKVNDNRLISRLPHRLVPDVQHISMIATRNQFNWLMLNNDVIQWCEENIGKSFHDWAWGTSGKFVLYFQTKEDAMAFKLRWS